jgi:hypothetical protein
VAHAMLSNMTVVLVHGNPETDAIWGPLVDALGRTDVVRLSPPDYLPRLPRLAPLLGHADLPHERSVKNQPK